MHIPRGLYFSQISLNSKVKFLVLLNFQFTFSIHSCWNSWAIMRVFLFIQKQYTQKLHKIFPRVNISVGNKQIANSGNSSKTSLVFRVFFSYLTSPVEIMERGLFILIRLNIMNMKMYIQRNQNDRIGYENASSSPIRSAVINHFVCLQKFWKIKMIYSIYWNRPVGN